MRKTIQITEPIKYRLDRLKGNRSYDSFLEDVATYFETSGISPKSNVVSPVLTMKEQANRIIEVMRGIEKSQRKEFAFLSDQIKNAHFSQLTQDANEAEAEETLRSLISDNEKKEKENQRLRTRVEELEKSPDPDGVDPVRKDDLMRVRNLIGEFNNDSRFEITGLQKNKYSYDKMFVIKSAREMEDILTSMINSL